MLTHRDPRFAAPNQLWTPTTSPDVWRTTQPVGSSIYRLTGERVLLAKDEAHFLQLVAERQATAWRTIGETQLYLEGADPRAGLWISSSDAAVVHCVNSPRLRLEGLDIRFGGAVGINFAGGCDDSVIDGVTIFGGRDGVRAKNGESQRITVTHSWIVNYNDRRWWWRDVKGNTPIEGGGLVVPGMLPTLEDNVIEGWFNGVVTACSCNTVGPSVKRNLIRDILDDAIEMDGVTVRGEISENLILDAFVGFSFAPRFVLIEGEDTWIHHNAVQVTRVPPFDRTLQALGNPTLTKFNGSAARDLLFENNTAVGEGNMMKGAPTGADPYPIHVRWLNNIIVSRVGPLVRHTGPPAAGNLHEGNVFWQLVPSGNAFQNWAVPLGQTNAFGSLAQVRSSAIGQATAWELTAKQADPQFVLPGQPSSLRPGSPAEGRGAFQRGSLRVDSVTPLPTGWILVRGEGFESTGQGLGLVDPIVISSTTAVAREAIDAPAPPTILGVEVQ